MVQLTILSGNKAGSGATFSRFPVQIGREPKADLPLDEPGVWDRHCQITWPSRDALFVEAHADALLQVNGNTVQSAALRNGDLITLGAVRMRFDLSPVRQRSLLLREALTWVAWAGLCAGQIALIYHLIR